MCEFCAIDPAERKRAREFAEIFAKQLEELAGSFRAIARGTIQPHTDAAKTLEYRSKAVLRELVNHI